jgi:hypothetical protein
MENPIYTNVYVDGIAGLSCATSASATLEVRGAAVRDLSAIAAVATRDWAATTTGMKRAGFAPTHAQGSLSWSPPL